MGKDNNIGESEALIILKNILDIKMDDDYHDDNSKPGMPDYRTASGVYIEITHTHHNPTFEKKLNDFADKQRKNFEEDVKIMGEIEARHKAIADRKELTDKIHCAQCRLSNNSYRFKSDGSLDESSIKQYNEDIELIKKCLGYDYRTGKYIRESERHINNYSYSRIFSINCITEAIKIKSVKHSIHSGNINLFLFAEYEEICSMLDSINETYGDTQKRNFYNAINNSPFNIVYICGFDSKYSPFLYDTNRPQLFCFERVDGFKCKQLIYDNLNNNHWKFYEEEGKEDDGKE